MDILKSAKKNYETLHRVKFHSCYYWICLENSKQEQRIFNLSEAEIPLDEIIKSINSETNNKPLGNDGLTAEFYRHFSNKLAPVLLGVYDSWGKLDTMGVTYRRGIISAIRAISRTNFSRKTGGHPKWEVPK